MKNGRNCSIFETLTSKSNVFLFIKCQELWLVYRDFSSLANQCVTYAWNSEISHTRMDYHFTFIPTFVFGKEIEYEMYHSWWSSYWLYAFCWRQVFRGVYFAYKVLKHCFDKYACEVTFNLFLALKTIKCL